MRKSEILVLIAIGVQTQDQNWENFLEEANKIKISFL